MTVDGVSDLPAAPPGEHAEKILEQLGVDDDRVRRRAIAVAERHAGEVESAPSTLGAAAVYHACQLYPAGVPTRAEIAEAADVDTDDMMPCFRTLAMSEWGAGDAGDDAEADHRGDDVDRAIWSFLFGAVFLFITTNAPRQSDVLLGFSLVLLLGGVVYLYKGLRGEGSAE